MGTTPLHPVTGVVICECGTEMKVPGTSWWRTLWWRLFGRHEGYNDWDMWQTWLPSWLGPPLNRKREIIR